MSTFLSKKFKDLAPYTPGEQPKDQKYIKLNTNESPYPPSRKAIEAAASVLEQMYLYSDPDCTALRSKIAETYGISPQNVICGNGSDDILSFAFSAFCDDEKPALFADITYGFYPVFAEYNRVPYKKIPLREDLTIDVADYFDKRGTVFIANPNAPTSLALPVTQIERLLKHSSDNVVVIDEAYVDFGAESCVPLIKKYDNLLITQTFSKSRSLAGARLGYGIASEKIISDLNTVRCSINPYNVSMATQAAGIGALCDREYTEENCKKIQETRADFTDRLRALGFTVAESQTNFVFARSDEIKGETLYDKLRQRGILVRHFSTPEIKDYNRITIGTSEQMQRLTDAVKEILCDTRK